MVVDYIVHVYFLDKAYQLYISTSTRGNVQKFDLFWYFPLALQKACHLVDGTIFSFIRDSDALLWTGTRRRTSIWLTVALFGYSLQSLIHHLLFLTSLHMEEKLCADLQG